MPAPQASADLYGALQRYQAVLLSAARRLWRRVVPGDLDGSWARVAPQAIAFTAGAQLVSAQAAVDYVPAVLEETGQPDDPMAAIRPGAFAGVATDGRPLDTLLEGGVRRVKALIGTGVDPSRALGGGQRLLEQALQTIVSDAARDATAAQIAVRSGMGWVRMVNPPCCSRCAVLAGKWYRWNDGFLRHPRCDCVHIPAAENRAGDFVTDPRELVRRGLITDLTQGQRRRLDDGQNLVRVLNESRDAWRVRMALERKRAKDARKRQTWGPQAPEPLPPGGIQDFLSHLTSRVDALKTLREHGIAD